MIIRYLINLSYLALPATLLGLAPSYQVANSEQHEYVPKAKATTLAQEELEGVQDPELIVKRFEIEPGFGGGRHSHTGPVYVYIAGGELTVDVDDLGRSVFKGGELYKKSIGRVIQGRNMSTSTLLTLVVFQVGEPGKPMMIQAEMVRSSFFT